jgi:LysM repeat protein/mono/diheme cytochrome c family protein
MNTQKQILLIVVLFFMLTGGCAAYTAIDLTVRAPEKKEYHYRESIERGALLFANNCRTCHGARGEGGVGLPLNTDAFKNQDPLVLKANRDLLRRTISCGRAATLMPVWLNTNGGSLNAVQIEHIIDLITEPLDPSLTDEDGNPTSKGWIEAYEFSKNLNHEASAVIGGDTLDQIAAAHGIGAKEVAALNNLAVNAPVAKGRQLRMPPSKQFPNGWTFKVDKSDQTLQKVAAALHIGAIIVADLNNVPNHLNVERATLTLRDAEGRVITGLYPGTKLKLPAGATYTVVEGNTVQSIAEGHGLTVDALVRANTNVLALLKAEDQVSPENSIELPAGSVAVVQAGQTFADIAEQHGLAPAELATVSGVAATTTLTTGQRIQLGLSPRYVVQQGDTVDDIARLHGLAPSVILNRTRDCLRAGRFRQRSSSSSRRLTATSSEDSLSPTSRPPSGT